MGKRKKRKTKIFSMYFKYGEHSEGVYCGGCNNCLVEIKGGKKIHKCIVYGTTSDKNTDWNHMYTACGYFNMPFDEYKDVPLIGIVGIRPAIRKEIMNDLMRQITWSEYKLKKYCTPEDIAYYEKVKSECKAKLAEFQIVEQSEHNGTETENKKNHE